MLVRSLHSCSGDKLMVSSVLTLQWHIVARIDDMVKLAEEFTSIEGGANKFAYSRRKVFWNVISQLVRSGYTSDAAVDRVYQTYGRNLSVSNILVKLRTDRRRGGHPSLLL